MEIEAEAGPKSALQMKTEAVAEMEDIEVPPKIWVSAVASKRETLGCWVTKAELEPLSGQSYRQTRQWPLAIDIERVCYSPGSNGDCRSNMRGQGTVWTLGSCRGIKSLQLTSLHTDVGPSAYGRRAPRTFCLMAGSVTSTGSGCPGRLTGGAAEIGTATGTGPSMPGASCQD